MQLTRHAQMRRKEMNVTEDQIAEVLRSPEITYTQGKAPYVDRRMYQRGDLAVVTNIDGDIVITVLWRCLYDYMRMFTLREVS